MPFWCDGGRIYGGNDIDNITIDVSENKNSDFEKVKKVLGIEDNKASLKQIKDHCVIPEEYNTNLKQFIYVRKALLKLPIFKNGAWLYKKKKMVRELDEDAFIGLAGGLKEIVKFANYPYVSIILDGSPFLIGHTNGQDIQDNLKMYEMWQTMEWADIVWGLYTDISRKFLVG